MVEILNLTLGVIAVLLATMVVIEWMVPEPSVDMSAGMSDREDRKRRRRRASLRFMSALVLLVAGLSLYLQDAFRLVSPPMDTSQLAQILRNHHQFREGTMPQLPPWPEEMVVSGDLRQWQRVVFKGEQIVAAVWVSKRGKLQIDGYPFDQMVLVLEGSVTLQPAGEGEKTHHVGDVFFVPKGYKGSWEMPRDYKELIVVERNAWVAVEGE